QQIMQQREQQALKLAVTIGDIERARKAAERLFGLNLDSDAQLQLATQMHQLGMHELAEGVLSRVRRRSGAAPETLMAVMQQYESQGNQTVAVQIAYQILQRSAQSGSQPSAYYVSGRSNNDEANRQMAAQVLQKAGKLDELIARTEEQ